jgi:hypothetical protein
MLKTVVLLTLASAALSAGAPARADSLSCQTVNGQTVCLRGSGALTCETVDGRTTCSAVPNDATPGAAATPRPVLPDVQEMLARQGVSVERQGNALRVRTGTVDLDLDPDLE